MDCKTTLESYVSALADGRPKPERVDEHFAACPACRAEAELLAATWNALGELPPLEPSERVGRALFRRLRWGNARDALVSLERWQQAALVGVIGFALSVLLGLSVPYETMVALCSRIVPPDVPAEVAYLLAGLVYGLLPMAVGMAMRRRMLPGQGAPGVLDALVVFLVVLVPYAVLRCGEFPPTLLAGFIGGITLGAAAGGTAGAWVTRRHA